MDAKIGAASPLFEVVVRREEGVMASNGPHVMQCLQENLDLVSSVAGVEPKNPIV